MRWIGIRKFLEIVSGTGAVPVLYGTLSGIQSKMCSNTPFGIINLILTGLDLIGRIPIGHIGWPGLPIGSIVQDGGIETGFPIRIRVTAMGRIIPVEFRPVAHCIRIYKVLDGRISRPVVVPIGPIVQTDGPPGGLYELPFKYNI